MVRACRVCQGQLLCKVQVMILAIIGTEKLIFDKKLTDGRTDERTES